MPTEDRAQKMLQDDVTVGESPVVVHAELDCKARAAARRFLVVDDNRDAADSLAILLRMTGCEVRAVYDGTEAIRIIAEFCPHVVLLDIGLPRLDGYEVGRRIREQLGRGVLLIAITGWGQEEDRRRTAAAGFDAHLTKPVDFEVLQRLLVAVSG
jgi:CheY-like chemotaxis protein